MTHSSHRIKEALREVGWKIYREIVAFSLKTDLKAQNRVFHVLQPNKTEQVAKGIARGDIFVEQCGWRRIKSTDTRAASNNGSAGTSASRAA